MAVEVKAIHKTARISAQKARLVADQIRGKKVSDAVNLLYLSNKKASDLIAKVLNSAIANAEHNEQMDVDSLIVKTIYVDKSVHLKRFRARAKGRGTRILRQTSHITVVVAQS